MAKQDTEDINQTNILLQNLLKRPDVRSTLILSRKDGSIIKAAGLIAEDPNELPTERTNTTIGVPDSRTGELETRDETRTEVEPEAKKSRAQILASSILHFVASATALSASLDRANHVGNATPSGDDSSEREELAKDNSPVGEDVQLLRLRLSKQEVIIFPDPSYLCCVVQDIDKIPR